MDHAKIPPFLFGALVGVVLSVVFVYIVVVIPRDEVIADYEGKVISQGQEIGRLNRILAADGW